MAASYHAAPRCRPGRLPGSRRDATLATIRGRWAKPRVLCHDPYVRDDRLTTLECVLEESDVLILGAPHRAYSRLAVGGRDVVDIWGALGDGIRL